MPQGLLTRMIDFVIPEVVNKAVKGMTAETFLEICGAYVRAWQDGAIDSELKLQSQNAPPCFWRRALKSD